MNHRKRRWLAVVLPMVLVLILGAGAVGAQDTPQGASAAAQFAAASGESVTGIEESFAGLASTAVRTPDGRLRVIVELRSEPAAVVFARAGGQGGGAAALAAADAQRSAIATEQASFLAGLAGAGIDAEYVSDTDTVANSVSLVVTSDQLAALLARPEVVGVYPVQRLERDTSTSIPQTGAPSAWNGTFGSEYTGAGMVIAIIDSGVDYSHRNNNGSGTWPTNPADRQTLADTGGTFPAGNKVIGGYDYVGDAFNAGNPEASGLPANDTRSPDPDPIDCTINPSALVPTFGGTPAQAPSGHGSHVAGIAAGFGVNADGTTYTGGYSSVPFGSLLIGPGAAPEASVLAMRVFGCFGSTTSDIVSEAIDDAVSGKRGAVADVINMSLGSSFGYGGDETIISFYNSIINNATLSGTLVVMSAGNSYDTFFTTGSPGSAPSGLSVASTSDGGYGGFLINGAEYPQRPSIGRPPVGVVGPYPFVYLAGDGCTAAQYNGFPANHFAVMNWTGACASGGLINAAGNASGNKPLGILVANNVPFAFQNLGCTPSGAAAAVYIHCVSIQQSVGQYLAANLSAQITLDASLIVYAPDLVDAISTFSSRGPSSYATSGLKPEIAAPGDAVTTTGSGTGNGTQLLGGTSMAAPTVAGIAALLRQAHPSWSPAQIKALLMNTANNDVYFGSAVSGPRVGVQRAGAGRVDVEEALANEVIAYNALRPDVVSVNFGSPAANPGETITVSREVRFQNKGVTSATYNLSIDTYSNANIASYSVNPSSVTVAGLSSVNVTVTLTVTVPVSGTLTGNRSDASMEAAQATTIGAFTRHYLTEETANLIATPTSGATVSLRVPLYSSPRSVSEMRAAENPIVLTGAGEGLGIMFLDGTGVFDASSGFPQAVVSSVTAFEYAGSDDIGDTTFPDGTLAGEYAPFPSLDIQYVGVASDYNTAAGGSLANTTAWFGISTAADWATPNEYYFIVYIDGNQNGFTGASDDYIVLTAAPNISGTTSRSDVFLSGVGLLSSPSFFYHEFLNNYSAGFNTYLLNNNVISIPFYPGMLLNYDGVGATPTTPALTDTTFDFYVEAFHRSWGTVDVSPVMTYDLANPMFDATDPLYSVPMYDDNSSNAFLFDYNFIGQPLPATSQQPAALLLHHHNEPNVLSANGQNFRRAEVVYVDADIVDIEITKYTSDADNIVAGGDALTFYIETENISQGTSAFETVTDVLPAAVGFVGASPECVHTGEPAGGTVTCEYLIGPDEVKTFYIDVIVDPLYVGNFTNTASVAVDVIEAFPADNEDSVTVSVTPPAPVLIAPEGDIFSTSPAFSWYDIDGADWYYLSLSDGANTIFTDSYEKVAVCSSGTCSVTPSLALPPGDYYWSVYAWNSESGAGPWSATMQFNVVVNPDVPTPIAPIGDITETNPLFQWTESAGANNYHLWVSQTDGPVQGHVTDVWLDAAGLCTGGICSYDAGLSLGAGRYTWWIQAYSTFGGYSGWSTGAVFDVNITPAAPTTIAPIGSITNQTPTFTFSKVPTGTWYYLWLSSSSSKILDQWYDGSFICNTTECSVTPSLVLNPGEYQWWVQTWSPYGGYSAWSSQTNFTVALAPEAPVQIGPQGSILQTNPTYTWQRSAGSTWYYVWVSGPGGHVLDQWVDASVVCSGSVCSFNAGVALADGVHRWWVQAWNPWGGYSAWTGPMIFNVNGPGAVGEPGAAPVQPVEVQPEPVIPLEVVPLPDVVPPDVGATELGG